MSKIQRCDSFGCGHNNIGLCTELAIVIDKDNNCKSFFKDYMINEPQ